MKKIFVAAGETSGDMHAAKVVNQIKQMAPETEFFGMGSDRLAQEGVNILLDPTGMNSIGFREVIDNFKTHRKNYKLIKKAIKRENPEVMFLVDYSGFNMLLARLGKKENIPVVSYFAPTAWIWGKWRARWMARMKATIAAVFPAEIDVYRRVGAQVKFVGHPLLDMVEPSEEPEQIYNKYDLDPDKPCLALLPGSRQAEVDRLLPDILKAVTRLQQKNEGLQLVLPVADNLSFNSIIERLSKYRVVVRVVKGESRAILQISDFAITASGTVTLEAAILNTPMLITYQTDKLTYFLGRKLLRKSHIGLPNLLSSREIVPELVQEDVTPEKIFQTVHSHLQKPYLRKEIKRNLERVTDMLGKKGAIKRTAKLVMEKGEISSE